MNAPQRSHDFEVSLHRQDGKLISRQKVDVDWEPALQWSLQRAIEEKKRPPLRAVGPAVIEPLWHETHKQPFISGFRAILTGANGTEPYKHSFTGAYFYRHVLAARLACIKAGLMTEDEQFIPCVLALESETPEAAVPGSTEDDGAAPPGVTAPAPRRGRMRVRQRNEELPLTTREIGPLLDGALTFSAGCLQEQDMPTLIPRWVLEETMAQMLATGEAETGGLLTGHLHRDPDSGRIFALITAQIPARHTVEQQAQLTLTPETFFAAKTAVRNRGQGELILGWWHSHPRVGEGDAAGKAGEHCGECEQPKCHRSTVFFSEDDCHVHRTVFPAAFGIALVLGARCSGEPDAGLFGWREGVIQEKAFQLIEGIEDPITGSKGEKDA